VAVVQYTYTHKQYR